MKVSIAAAAEQELTQAARYYAEQANVELGRALIAEFQRSVDLCCVRSPGSARPGYTTSDGCRCGGFR